MARGTDDAVWAAREQIMERLRNAPAGWLSATQARGSKRRVVMDAFASMVEDGTIASLGKVGRSNVYALTGPADGAKEQIRRIADEHIDKLERDRTALRSRLVPARLSLLKQDADKSLPSGVRAMLLDAFKARVRSRTAFTMKIGSTDYFLFASDLRAALGAAATPERALQTAARPGTSTDVADRVRAAYEELRARTGLRNVPLLDLEQTSGVSRHDLHRYLHSERRARRANATVGEPTAASEAQLAAALAIEGRPHLYIELYGEGAA